MRRCSQIRYCHVVLSCQLYKADIASRCAWKVFTGWPCRLHPASSGIKISVVFLNLSAWSQHEVHVLWEFVTGLCHRMATISGSSDLLTVTTAPVSAHHPRINEKKLRYQFVESTSISTKQNAEAEKDLCMHYRGRRIRECACQTDRYLSASLVAEHAISSTLQHGIQLESHPAAFHALLALMRVFVHTPSSLVKATAQNAPISADDNSRPETPLPTIQPPGPDAYADAAAH